MDDLIEQMAEAMKPFTKLHYRLDNMARAALAAIAAHPRFELVELPEPGQLSDHHEDDSRVWYFGQEGEFVVYADSDVVTDSEGFDSSPELSRECAAALLAAAKAAEEAN